MNSHEAAARLRKATALLAVIDRNARLCGLPELSGARGADTVRVLSARDWVALASAAGVHPPSISTVALIVETVGARGAPPEKREGGELFPSEIPF